MGNCSGQCSCCSGAQACAFFMAREKRSPVLIVFDLDGTIVDSRELARVCYQRVFELLGYGKISDAQAESFNGPDADEVCRVMGIGPDRRALYDQLVDEVCVELIHSIGKTFPGTLEVFQTLAPNAVLAILTNGTQRYCETCIEQFGLTPYVELHSGFRSGVSKAQRMQMWAQEIGARRIIVVGDRGTDIENARAAGAVAIGVTYGMGSREELADADVLCDNTRQLTNVCLEWIARP